MKTKKTKHVLLLFFIMFASYLNWLIFQPVTLIAVHEDGDTSDILVNRFPWTLNGKINWWLENKSSLKEKYDIPKPESDGSFSIYFWIFGDGYKKTDGYDRLCFNDMKTEFNCIDKDRVFSVSYSKNLGLEITSSEGNYRLSTSGEIVKSNRRQKQ